MNALVIMAKEPAIGEVKTRLTPALSPETAAELYINFLFDKIDQVNEIEDAAAFIAYYPPSGRKFFLNNSPDNFELIEQEGKDLGERLNGVSSDLIRRGFKKVLMLDSDSPNLPTSYIRQGISRLDEADIVLGPTEDGGYYLIGLKADLPEIFHGIPWSTPDVIKVTKKKIAELRKTRYILEKWYDVDTIDDLKRLKKELTSFSETKTSGYLCKNTFKVVGKIDEINKL